jgi:hypothetical protein
MLVSMFAVSNFGLKGATGSSGGVFFFFFFKFCYRSFAWLLYAEKDWFSGIFTLLGILNSLKCYLIFNIGFLDIFSKYVKYRIYYK